MCNVVKSQAMYKEFFYCREHKVECASMGCSEQPKSNSIVDESKFMPGDELLYKSGTRYIIDDVETRYGENRYLHTTMIASVINPGGIGSKYIKSISIIAMKIDCGECTLIRQRSKIG